MNIPEKTKSDKIHTRSIEINTYEYNDQHLLVEGSLTDRRTNEYFLITGEKEPPGIIHHMVIRMLVNISTLTIDDIEVEMPTVPRGECLETINCLAPVRGMRIASGFTLKVKELVGGIKGCSHLLALLTSMAPAAIQGYGAYQSQKPAGYGPNLPLIIKFLINTCWPWREDSPLVKQHLPK
ncbi:MAG: DUF2889 domain-containing protein [Syntrophales bacterium]|jgi:hypothetical protein